MGAEVEPQDEVDRAAVHGPPEAQAMGGPEVSDPSEELAGDPLLEETSALGGEDPRVEGSPARSFLTPVSKMEKRGAFKVRAVPDRENGGTEKPTSVSSRTP